MTNIKENKMINEVEKGSPVRIVAFLGGNWSGHGSGKKNKMPDNYLSQSGLPKPLIELVKKNGWTDKEGNVYYEDDFQPKPYFDEEKNITWILANDKTEMADIMAMSTEAFVKNHSDKK